MENNKEKNNTAIKIAGIVMIIVAIAVGFVVGKSFAEAENIITSNPQKAPSKEENTNNSEPIVNDLNESGISTTYEYTSFYGIEENEDENGKVEKLNLEHGLYLRDDGTFFLWIADYGNGDRRAGNYTVDGNKLLLKETVHYGSDVCFWTNNLRNYEGTINNGKIDIKLNVSDPDGSDKEIEKVYTFELTNNKEDPESRAWHSANPKDGEQIDATTDEKWMDCTNKTRY